MTREMSKLTQTITNNQRKELITSLKSMKQSQITTSTVNRQLQPRLSSVKITVEQQVSDSSSIKSVNQQDDVESRDKDSGDLNAFVEAESEVSDSSEQSVDTIHESTQSSVTLNEIIDSMGTTDRASSPIQALHSSEPQQLQHTSNADDFIEAINTYCEK